MRILFLVTAHNSLSQRTQIALTEEGHEISVAVVSTPLEMEAAVARHMPHLKRPRAKPRGGKVTARRKKR